MSASLQLYMSFVLNDGEGNIIRGGDRINPVSVATVSGPYIDLHKALADSTTWDAWTGGDSDSALSAFDFLWIESDLDVFLELTVDQNAGVGREEIAFTLLAGVPFILGSNVGKANYTADFAAGSDDVIDRIRIRNENGDDETANIRVFMAV